jgi:hypothetical protein
MAAFHVCRFMLPGRSFHGLAAYVEHAEAFVWALRALGHDTSFAVNGTRPDATNIVFGAQMLADAQVDQLPTRSVIYNFEQMARLRPEDLKPVLRILARRFPIWDFSDANLAAWKALGARDPQYVKVGWAPVLERIAPAPRQDIEALIYGTPSGERLEIYQALCRANLCAMFVFGLYGAERDALIARSKVVINASAYTSRIFEIARVSYLLANGKAVVSLAHPDTFVEPDMRQAVRFVPAEAIAEECLALVEDDARRSALGDRGRHAMRARDMREILRPVLAQLPGA